MADRVTVTSHNSYGSRVSKSFKNILVGILLVIGSIVLLAWNEKNYVEQKAALQEWASLVQEAVADQINPDLDGKEVHISWKTASDAEALQDSTFGVVTDDLILKRTVEMYQWYEESSEECHDNMWWSEDCTTTYDYYTKWSDEAIDSSSFYSRSGHENPSNRKYQSESREKSPITLWAYTLTPVFISQLTNFTPINLSEQNVRMPENAGITVSQTATQADETTSVEDNNNSYLYGDSENSEEENNIEESANTTVPANWNYIYIWANSDSPAIGDLRISFSSVKPWTVSIVWKQLGNELTSFTVSNGRSINLLEQWNVTAEDMFLHAMQANKMMAWIIRFLGLFLMYCGFSLLFQFIETLAKVIPFLANIIWVWTGIIALWLTLIVWFLTIWIARLAVRPVIWICCLVVAAGGIFLLVKSKKNKKAIQAEQEKVEEKVEEKSE